MSNDQTTVDEHETQLYLDPRDDHQKTTDFIEYIRDALDKLESHAYNMPPASLRLQHVNNHLPAIAGSIDSLLSV